MHLIDTDKVCGPGKTILETAKSLKDSDFQIVISAFNYSKEMKNEYLEILKSKGFETILIPTRNQLDFFAIFR